MTDDQIKHMANRFLGWKLPDDFRPDAGIKFEPHVNPGCSYDHNRDGPIGTNLFSASQAEAMVRHMLEGCEALLTVPKPEWSDAVPEQITEPRCFICGEVATYPHTCLTAPMWVSQKHTDEKSDNIQPTPPEPTVTEDHLRRACKMLNCSYDRFLLDCKTPLEKEAVHTVARQLAIIDGLRAERDAMQAMVEGPQDFSRATLEHNLRTILRDSRDVHPDTMLRRIMAAIPVGAYPAEPTPDPDLVLAREAAAQEEDARENFNISANIRQGISDCLVGVQSALRALKLAKEQGSEH